MGDETAQQLNQLVSKGDVGAVEALLRELRERSPDKKTGDHQVSQAILSCEHGGRNSKSALHCAATLGRSEILRVLLSQGVNPDSTDDTGNTPLHFAADLGQARAARVLLDASANRDARNNFGRKPVDNAKAASWDSAKISTGKSWVRRMFEGEIDPWESLPAEDVPVQRPVAAPEAVPQMSQAVPQMAGAGRRISKTVARPTVPQDDPLPMDLDPSSQYHPAAARGRQANVVDVATAPFTGTGQATLRELIKNDDAIGLEDWLRYVRSSCDGPEAVKDKHVMMAVSSCEEGDLGHDVRVAHSGLHFAALHGKVNALRVMLATNADPNSPNDQGSTPLHLAVDVGRHEAVQLLLQAKANPFAVNNFGRTPHEVREGRAHLDPASSALSPDCIRLSTVSLSYHTATGKEAATDCGICCEPFREGDRLRVLPCLHKYHAACVERWLARSLTCPTCKLVITDVNNIMAL